MSVTVKTEGFRDLERAMQDLAKSTARGLGRRALLQAAKPLVAIASSKAPDVTGELQAAVALGTKLSVTQQRQHRKIKQGVEAFVGVTYEKDGGRYGGLVEFGTVNTDPQPFLRPAWAQDQGAMLKRLQTALREELDKTLERARRKAARLAAKP